MPAYPTIHLSDPVSRLPSIGPKTVQRLTKLNISTLDDLLNHFPFRYLDYSLISTLGQVQPGELVTVKVKLKNISSYQVNSSLSLQKALAFDQYGQLTVTWFNQPYLMSQLKTDIFYYLAGKISASPRGHLQLNSPEIEPAVAKQAPSHTAGIIGVYPTTAGISSKWLRAKIKLVLNQLQPPAEYLPSSLLVQHNLVDLTSAYRQIHFPSNQTALKKAKFRLSVHQLTLRMLRNLIAKHSWLTTHPATPIKLAPTQQKQVKQYLQLQPFTLTSDQSTAIATIQTDLAQANSMNRLLQGDVGSGKTIVAAAAAYITFLARKKTLILAPTTILAKQHYTSIKTSFKGIKSPPRLKLVTSQTRAKIPNLNSADIIIGTHALLHQPTPKNTGLVIIDEQHRFGVKQRGYFNTSSSHLFPHTLTMTATPIPRTISLTRYGHLDVSRLTSLPSGRQKITTWLVPNHKRTQAYTWIQSQLIHHHTQAYIICPFVDSSTNETLANVKAATSEYRTLTQKIFPSLKLGLVHGRLKETDKNRIIHNFHQKKLNILVATPVIEVGIDNPNAQIILVEGAERFGLAQLHQLRGRVGRGKHKSYCLLFTSPGLKPSQFQRLKLMTETNSGEKLAEADLFLRGSGEITGTSQHGHPNFSLANPDNPDQLKTSKHLAAYLMNRYRHNQLDTNLLEILDPDKIARVSPN